MVFSASIPLERDYSFRVWRKEHGLPDDRIQCLHADRRGFLWAGTRRGLVRFDGNRFDIWSRSTSELFGSEDCRALTEDAAGNLWVGTMSGVVRLGASPRMWGLGGDSLAGLPEKFVREFSAQSMAVARDGRLVVGSAHGLLEWASEGRGKLVALPEELESRDVGTRYCPAVLAGAGGEIWAAPNGALLGWNPQSQRWTSEPILGYTNGLPHVFALAQTTDGAVHAVIGRWQDNDGRLYRQTSEGWQKEADDEVSNFSNPPWLAADRHGGIWYTVGVVAPIERRLLVHRTADRVLIYRLDILPEDEVLLCLTEDLEGNLWLGLSQGGLLCLSPRRVQTLTTADGLPDDNTWTLLEASDGALWIGTDRGVVRLQGENREVLDTSHGLYSDNIRALAEDREGRIWIGTGGGLSIWDQGELTPLRFSGEWYRSKTRVVLGTRDGAMWVGAAQGLHRVKNGEQRTWLPADGLPNENVLALLEDRRGDLWLGTEGGGLARFKEGRFEVYGREEGLSSLNVWVIHEDTDGLLWLGTDRGINCLREGRIQAITTEQGLPDNLINGLVEDQLGWFWIGHDNGIYRVKRQALLEVLEGRRQRVECIRYDGDDGLLALETNGQKSQPPALRLRDGRVAFTTIAGVAIFDPAHPPGPTHAPPVQIERFVAGGREIFSAVPGLEPPGKDRPAQEWARLEPGAGHQVEIAYTASFFRKADDLRFRYRLLGLDEAWQDAGGRRSAAFAFLPPGDYVFEVQAGSHYGRWSEEPATIAFRVIPHFYERHWVQGAGVLLVLCVGLAVVRWRMAELRRWARLEEESARAQERLRLARELHDGLGSNLTELTLLSGVGDPTQAPAEDLAWRFQRLSESTHEALHALRDLIWTTSPQADTLEGLTSRLRRHAERLGEAAKLPVRYDLPLEMPDITLGPNARRALLRALDEALNNAVRHAGATEIWLRVGANEEEWFVEVADNGRGFEVPDPASESVAAADPDHGLGLASMRERVESLDGCCEIHSQPRQGTRVHFSFPLTGWEARG